MKVSMHLTLPTQWGRYLEVASSSSRPKKPSLEAFHKQPMASPIDFGNAAAAVFDLDGTLVETELLKARSYARVAQRLCACTAMDSRSLLDPAADVRTTVTAAAGPAPPPPADASPGQVCADAAMEIFKGNIGATSRMVSEAMVGGLRLEGKLAEAQERFGSVEPWEALYKLRKEVYLEEFATEANVVASAYDHNLSVLRAAVDAGLPVGVATSSSTPDAERVLGFLGVRPLLASVLGADRVTAPKPHPEPYLESAAALGVPPPNILVLEDSMNGVAAAVAAGVGVVAVANPFTEAALREQSLLDQKWVVYDVAHLPGVVTARCAEMPRRSAEG